MQILVPQPTALKAYSPAWGVFCGVAVAGPLPTNTTPLTTAGGEANPEGKLIPVHSGSHRGLPHPAAGEAGAAPMGVGAGEAWGGGETKFPGTAPGPPAPPAPGR